MIDKIKDVTGSKASVTSRNCNSMGLNTVLVPAYWDFYLIVPFYFFVR